MKSASDDACWICHSADGESPFGTGDPLIRLGCACNRAAHPSCACKWYLPRIEGRANGPLVDYNWSMFYTAVCETCQGEVANKHVDRMVMAFRNVLPRLSPGEEPFVAERDSKVEQACVRVGREYAEEARDTRTTYIIRNMLIFGDSDDPDFAEPKASRVGSWFARTASFLTRGRV